MNVTTKDSIDIKMEELGKRLVAYRPATFGDSKKHKNIDINELNKLTKKIRGSLVYDE